METKGFGHTRTFYEIRIVFDKQQLTMQQGDPFDTLEDAERQARQLHAEDGEHYKVTKITQQCVFRINSN